MALEFLTGNLIYNFLKDVVGVLIRKVKPRSPEAKITLRQKWKPKFEEHIRDHFAKELRSDVIIRDVKRVDQYPDADEKKGISAWFRGGLVGTYHRGILFAFHWNKLIEVGNGEFRFIDDNKDDQVIKDDALKVLLIGLIPFENIQDVDFDGDEYYICPHIYCHFANKREPYERVAYFTKNQISPDSLPHYSEVVEASAVRKTSLRLGVKSPYL